MTLEILVIEDNERYLEAAADFLAIQGVDTTFASDYDGAMHLLDSRIKYFDWGKIEYEINRRMFNYAIIDCFFPKTAGSSDISLGLEAVEKMRKVILPKRHGPISKTLEQVETLLGKGFAKLAASNAKIRYEDHIDHYFALEQAMKESPSNQPLGILVAEKAESLGIPFVLATSTHHHDMLTQPVYDYAAAKGWRLIDCKKGCEEDKASQQYWARVYSELLARNK